MLPHSICSLVAPETACVQHKANTPEVGCTLRSLSHNLALLPGRGVVETEWRMSPAPGPQVPKLGRQIENRPFNVMLIPFPYVIHGESFGVSRQPEVGADGYFCVQQTWLFGQDHTVSAIELAQFVIDLLTSARKNFSSIDAIVFPEASLTPSLINDLAVIIARFDHSLEFVIGGVLDNYSKTNEACVIVLDGGEVVDTYAQRKHHRWKLDEAQITNYHLGHALHPKNQYWEDIDLWGRKVHFSVSKGDAVITALVCEDLARADPVMPALASIGPNLIFALLMDGPQLIGRWSSRHATSLADDPGAAILTFTCLGMVLRSKAPGKPLPGSSGRRCIALWRQPGGDAHEIDLPPGAHAMVLSLSPFHKTQVALDLREDGCVAQRYTVSSAQAISAHTTPPWLEIL